jgi:hypothetical protein
LNQDPNHWDNPPEETSISISEMVHFLRVRAVQLFVVAIITGMISLGAGYFVRIAAPESKIASYEFAFTFDGAAEKLYPNGVPFSPQDVLAAPVLDTVYDSLHLKERIEQSDFRKIFTISQGGTSYALLHSEFEQKLSDNKLSAPERIQFEMQYRAALDALGSNSYILTGDFTNSKLCEAEIQQVITTIPTAWANFVKEVRGLASYDISVPTVADSDIIKIGDDYIFAAENLRATAQTLAVATKLLIAKPGSKIVRDTDGRKLVDLVAEIEPSYATDVLPTYLDLFRLAYEQNPERVIRIFTNRIDIGKQAVAKAKSEAEITTTAFQNYIMLSNGGDTHNDTSDGNQEKLVGGSNMPMVNLNADFIDRLIGQGVAANDLSYRQKLNDGQLRVQTSVLVLEDSLATDEWLYEQIVPKMPDIKYSQTTTTQLLAERKDTAATENAAQASYLQGGSSTLGDLPSTTPMRVQAIVVAAQNTQDRQTKFCARTQNFYDLLSKRNLNPSSILYSSPYAPFVIYTNSVSLKQILTTTVAAECLALGISLLIMATRKRQHA